MEKTIGIIGAGKMGGSLSVRLEELGYTVIKSTQHGDRNLEIAASAKMIILAVKPNQAEAIARVIRDHLGEDVKIISFMAAAPLAKLQEMFGRREV